jgi:hypothetical protein
MRLKLCRALRDLVMGILGFGIGIMIIGLGFWWFPASHAVPPEALQLGGKMFTTLGGLLAFIVLMLVVMVRLPKYFFWRNRKVDRCVSSDSSGVASSSRAVPRHTPR